MFTSQGLLARGGFGDVDLVIDAVGAKFARKTLAENQPLTPELRDNVLKRFKKEVRTQIGISCRNIVPIVYAQLDVNPPYYLMPVAQSSLSADIAVNRTLSGAFVPALSDIVAGLEVIHSMHIYHRDLKPQNVLRFTDSQGQPYYAISDFGLISLQESQLSALTSTGMARGSDYYTAPEVTQDLRRASVQSDIYSLGCILHDFVGVDSRVPCGEIREDSPYGAILRGCTRREPASRFKSARAVLDAVLSVGGEFEVAKTQQAADFVVLLASEAPIPAAGWRSFADYVYSVKDDHERRAVFMALSEARIAELCEGFSEDARVIGVSFAHWVGNSNFNFDYCDALANRLESFFVRVEDLELKSATLMAMLAMGTSHNRWYVEHKFARMAGAGMDASLAARLAIEFRILDKPVCHQISHLEGSIGVSRTILHPAVQQAIVGICG